MKNEFAFIMFKPDVSHNARVICSVLSMIYAAGFKIEEFCDLPVEKTNISRHYKHLPALVIDRIISWYSSRAFLPGAIVRGEIALLRELVGHTDPSKARPGSIRRSYSEDSCEAADNENRALKNVIHCSDCLGSAIIEIGIWMPWRYDAVGKALERGSTL